MDIRFTAPTPLQYFASLVQNDDTLPLFEAAASLAQDEYPELDIEQVLGDVDQLPSVGPGQGLSPVKWCNKSGQRSAAVPDVKFLSKCCC